MRNLHIFKNKYAYEMKAFRAEDGEEVAFFTITKSFKSLCEPIDEQNELNVKIKDYEHG